jgi:major membrane immunogen (membrane-anchored lipoprotein)
MLPADSLDRATESERTVRLAVLVVVAVLLLTGCGRMETDDASTPSATFGAGTADTEKLIHAQKIRTQAIELQIAESVPVTARFASRRTERCSPALGVVASG